MSRESQRRKRRSTTKPAAAATRTRPATATEDELDRARGGAGRTTGRCFLLVDDFIVSSAGDGYGGIRDFGRKRKHSWTASWNLREYRSAQAPGGGEKIIAEAVDVAQDGVCIVEFVLKAGDGALGATRQHASLVHGTTGCCVVSISGNVNWREAEGKGAMGYANLRRTACQGMTLTASDLAGPPEGKIKFSSGGRDASRVSMSASRALQ